MRAQYLYLALICCGTTWAAEVLSVVRYVASGNVYLDQGRAAGVAVGDSVVIRRGDAELARLAISFIADASSSAIWTGAPDAIKVGDTAVVRVQDSVQPIVGETPAVTTAPYDTLIRKSFNERGPRDNQLTGRIGISYVVQDDREPVNYDYSEPSLSLRAGLSRIQGGDFAARVNLRLRRTERGNDALSSSSHRIYEALLAYEPTDKPLSAGVGRFILRDTRGMGYLDGVYVQRKAGNDWRVGALGGIEPDLQNTRIQSDVTKAGLYAAHTRPIGESSELAATASVIGRYRDGEVSREFFYQQVNLNIGSKLWLFESTELNLNRGWLQDAEGSTIKLASLLVDARYRVSRRMNIALGYDNRTNYYTAETRNLPDSLFASALQQGFRASIEARFAMSYFAEAGVGVRDGDSESAQATSGWARLGSTDLAKSGVQAALRVRWFDSFYSTGLQPVLQLSRDVVQWLNAGVEVGQNDFELAQTGEQVTQQWIAFMLDADLARRYSARTELELGSGEGREATLFTVGLGYRF